MPRLIAVKHFFREGEWLDSENPDHQQYFGDKLTFNDLTTMTGQLILYTMYTESRKWVKVVRVHSFVDHPANAITDFNSGITYTRSLVYTDGGNRKDFGRVNEYWFTLFPDHRGVAAFRLRKRGFSNGKNQPH